MTATAILPVIMNKADGERIRELCSRIEAEHNRQKFLLLVEELNKLLSSKHVPHKKDDDT